MVINGSRYFAAKRAKGLMDINSCNPFEQYRQSNLNAIFMKMLPGLSITLNDRYTIQICRSNH